MKRGGGSSRARAVARERREQLEQDLEHVQDVDFEAREDAFDASHKPKLEGHLTTGDPYTAQGGAIKTVQTRYAGTGAYMDAINRAVKDYEKYQDSRMKKTIAAEVEDHDALKDFDEEVEKIKYEANKNRPRKVQPRYNTGLGAKYQGGADGQDAGDQIQVEITGKPCGDTPLSLSKKSRPPRYPRDCHPPNVWLPFAPKDADYHAKGTAWSDTNDVFAASFKTGNRKLHAPGWLIDLSAPQLRAAYKIKKYMTELEKTDDVTEAVDDLHELLLELGITDVTKPEITRALRWLPIGHDTGLDYRVFLLAIGDFGYASIRHAIRPYPRKLKCREDQSDVDLYQQSQFDKDVMALFEQSESEFDSFFEITDTPKPKLVLEKPPFPIRNVGEYVPTKERQAMTEWRTRQLERQAEMVKKQAEWAQRLLNERQKVVQQQRRLYEEQLQEKKRKEAEEKQKKEEEEARRRDLKKRQIEKYIAEGWPPLTAAKKAETYLKRLEYKDQEKSRYEDVNTYSPRVQTAWTGLFIAEMYEALDAILPWAKSTTGYVPHKVAPKNEILYKSWREDQIENAANAPSPYLSPISIVSNRIERTPPKKCDKGARKCIPGGSTKVAFDHWIMDMPVEGEGRIIVTENRYRIKQILDYVFSKEGSALCVLPRVELLLHFVHNLVDQLLDRMDKNSDDCGPKDAKSGANTSAAPSAVSSKANNNAKDAPPPAGGKADEAKNLDKVNDPGKAKNTAETTAETKNTAEANNTTAVNDLGEVKPGSASEKPSTAPFRNPERDLPPVGCNPQPQLPYRQICKGIKHIPPRNLPAKFEGLEKQWVRKYAESLYKPANPAAIRPEQEKISFRNVAPIRERLEKFHAKEWDAYNCRRYRFRKNLWENMQVENYSDVLRNRFANSFWALLPHDNRRPGYLVNTEVERSIN